MNTKTPLGLKHLQAFYSAGLYREDGFRGRGANAWYLLVLLALCVLPGAVGFNQEVRKFLAQDAGVLIDQIPTVTITRGQAAVSAPQPYAITDPETGKAFAVLDTRPEADLSGATASLLLTRDQLIYRKDAVETRSFSLAEIESLVVDRTLAWRIVRGVGGALQVASYPVALAWSFLVRLIQALIYGWIGLAFFAVAGERRLKFSGVYRIAVLALTPAIVLQTLLGLFSVRIPGQAWISFFLTLGYLGFGVRAVTREPKADPVAPEAPTPVHPGLAVSQAAVSAPATTPAVRPVPQRRKPAKTSARTPRRKPAASKTRASSPKTAARKPRK